MRSVLAPNLPRPAVGENASIPDYLMAARTALAVGRLSEAQQALEMAETRRLDRSVPLFQTTAPVADAQVARKEHALHTLAAGDRRRAMRSLRTQSRMPTPEEQCYIGIAGIPGFPWAQRGLSADRLRLCCSTSGRTCGSGVQVSVLGSGGDSERRLVWRGGVGGGGHRTSRLGWSCDTSTEAERGSDDRREIAAIRVAGEGW
jgi:hypothetical protein